MTSLQKSHIRYRVVETAPSPLGEVMLRRYETGEGQSGYEIRLNGNFLMATHGNSSDKAMARLAWEMIEGHAENLRVLVGGLGAGYTLQAALALPGVSRVVVVEISEKVVAWNKAYFAQMNGSALDDARVEVCVEDLADHLIRNKGRYHLALLDVDNGPGWLAAQGNAGLYEVSGIEAARDALLPGGALAVWSPSENEVFRSRFQEVFPHGRARDTTAVGRDVGEPGDVIYLGRKET